MPSFAPEPYIAWMEDRPPSLDAPPGPMFTPGGYHRLETPADLEEADVDAALAAVARL